VPLTTVQAGMLDTTAQYYSFKNRIFNGSMVIDQRNAGASVTITAGGVYPVDRFAAFEDTDGTMTAEQVQVAPAGFTDSLVFTTGTADTSLSAAQYCGAVQLVEGFNVADLGWGTANASTVTLSFWVRSSLTGTFSGSLRNSAADRAYVFTYSISSANTWEYKTITVAGDTSGTWLTNNGIGLRLWFSFGAGSTYSTSTTGSWVAGNFFNQTGSVALIGTASATFYITGVQLEKGSTATSFDYRPYGTELALCQRYYEKSYNVDVVPGTATTAGAILFQVSSATQTCFNSQRPFAVQKRATPTITYYNPNSGAINSIRDASASSDFSVLGNFHIGASSTGAVATNSNVTANNQYQAHYTASIEL
jgi:hypothetical protein